VTIDYRVFYGIIKEISPEVDVNRKEFMGENRETYWKNIFDFNRLKMRKKKVFTGIIESDEVSTCVYYRRLKADRLVPSSASPVTKDAENKEADPATQEVQENDTVVSADPGKTKIVSIAVPKRTEDGIDGNFRQRDVRLLRFARARYYRESGIMNARKNIEAWNAGMKEHLEAISQVTSRGANLEAFREFMKTQAAHWDALWKEYIKPRWARRRMNLYCGKQRAFTDIFHELSALKEVESHRLVVGNGAGRWASIKGCIPAPTT
jgi:hypothetical protein